MKATVIGLGVEGKKATNSLLKHGWKVYATDLNPNIDLEGLDVSVVNLDVPNMGNGMTVISKNIQIDLGYTDESSIENADAVAFSPSMWGSSFANRIVESGKLLSDVLTKHKDIFTIGITGTNGKTTTVHMIKEILESAGLEVLVGGNGGGGFDGYYDLILEAEESSPDVLLIEVCDMTLDFCNYCFDFDLIGLTNMGMDHMDVHGTVANYKNALVRFFKGNDVVINHNQDFKSNFKEAADNLFYYFESQANLQIFGEFNRFNAGLATAIASELKIPKETIFKALADFKAVEGRLDVYPLNDSKIYIGKTDNIDALKSVLNEDEFHAIFMGTPRFNESDRLDMLDEVVKYNPEVIVIFPGLDDTVDMAVQKVNYLGYDGRLEVVNNLDELIALVAEFSHENAMFIGGNGQETIIEIQDRIKTLSKNCS
ncbi:MAG: Mur ligase family protein [Methanobrevibacter sp.]|uniref:Mur ligase family protein n=1 Tax=Methanobrevibacter sp. TaxID=66852 RepID=UPI0026DF722F|nr:Mur ligase family protein [Methanobrevibacter sp.]MDO5849223.1 Mur ligase family protein [Methanobrevibacter sp.]